jgi:BMFP domain-containing protein YqiC
MQTQNRLLDDLARVAGGALDVAAGMRSEVEARLREQFEGLLGRMDLVTREEFDAVKAMAVKAREEQERLAERVAALEAAVGGAKKTTAKRTAKPAAPKRKTPKKTSGG